MSKKREVFERLVHMFSSLKHANSTHLACISDFQNLVEDFVKSDFAEYQPPEHYADCLSERDIPLTDPLTANLPPELASAILLLQEELKHQHQSFSASQRMMDIYADHLHIALQNCENCACCGKLFAKSHARTVPAEDGMKVVCDNCFGAEYFDCHKCKRILPNSEQAEEDEQLGYGWICKNCTKPMGFPNEVVIAPDFEGCEDVAAADLAALCKYARRSTVWMEPDSSDTIKLKLVERLSEHDAIYENKNGLKYEIGKLDWRGIGSMQAAEDK